jgi:hypothetical protein
VFRQVIGNFMSGVVVFSGGASIQVSTSTVGVSA